MSSILTRCLICIGLLGLAATVAGCGGTRSFAPLPAAPGGMEAVRHATTGTFASYTITIPKHVADRQLGDPSRYTQSLAIRVPGISRVVVNALAGSANCKAALHGLECTFTFAVPSGKQTIAVTAFAQKNATGSAVDQGDATATFPAQRTTPVAIPLHPVADTFNDGGPGSLREAVSEALDGETAAVIVRAPGTIELTSGPVQVPNAITILGPADVGVTVNALQHGHAFNVTSTKGVAIEYLKIENGFANWGGAIVADGPLALRNVAFDGNVANRGGGAVYAEDLEVDACRFVDNVAGGAVEPSAFGGAIYSTGTLEVTNSSFVHDSALASGYAYGGAVMATGKVSLSGVTFERNVAGAPLAFGGALYTQLALAATTGRFDDNKASGTGTAAGGAIYAKTVVTLTSTAFLRNEVATAHGGGDAYGGAIGLESGRSRLTLLDMQANTAYGGSGYGGAIWIGNSASASLFQSSLENNAVSATTASLALGGGAIYNDGIATVEASTLSANAARSFASGGGIYNNEGATTVVNSTLDGNTAGIGGGIYNLAGRVGMLNATIYLNSATSRGGNVENASNGIVTLANDVIAGGSAPAGPDIDNAGRANSQGYNVIETSVAGNPLQGTTATNIAANPKLLSLANNGGPTKTNAETATSPGRFAIPLAKCTGLGITTDQRGKPRGSGGQTQCDAGAYQWQP